MTFPRGRDKQWKGMYSSLLLSFIHFSLSPFNEIIWLYERFGIWIEFDPCSNLPLLRRGILFQNQNRYLALAHKSFELGPLAGRRQDKSQCGHTEPWNDSVNMSSVSNIFSHQCNKAAKLIREGCLTVSVCCMCVLFETEDMCYKKVYLCVTLLFCTLSTEIIVIRNILL